MSGPGSYDCWGFAVMVQRNHFNRIMPDIADRRYSTFEAARIIESHEERDNWVEVTLPITGDLVLMARRCVPVHIGIWLQFAGKSGVLHCVERAGVVFSDKFSLKSMGFGSLTYYHPKV